ncbi:hypothetical protein ABT269_32470 [Streptomyces viridosporus]|uniref:hypothetical protein n=1 Tax=Streptomyces viridosporus TaxID=67581 RepID=UPI0033335EE1
MPTSSKASPSGRLTTFPSSSSPPLLVDDDDAGHIALEDALDLDGVLRLGTDAQVLLTLESGDLAVEEVFGGTGEVGVVGEVRVIGQRHVRRGGRLVALVDLLVEN